MKKSSMTIQMSEMMKKELTDIIVEHVVNTFLTMFDVNVLRVLNSNVSFSEDDLLSQVVLYQDDFSIVMRFAFPRNLISPLLVKIYDPVMAKHETVIEDAACEIANIVCSGLKASLNRNGYHLDMHLPKISHNRFNKELHDPNVLNLDFLLEDRGFSVDLNLRDPEGA